MKAFKRVSKLFLGTLVGLLATEIALHLIPQRLLPGEFRILDRVYEGRVKWQEMIVGDRRLGYHYRNGLDASFPIEGGSIRIQTTDHGVGDVGFRDLGSRPPFDLVAVGDSFTFCDDVPAENCWLKKLGEITGLSVGSMGVSGFSTMAEARVVEHYVSKLTPRPAVTLVAIFPNDFNDNIDFSEWQQSGTDNFWTWRGQREGRGPVFRWIADHSVVARIFDGAFRTRARYTFTFKRDGLDFVFQPWWLEPMDAERQAQRAQGWALMRKALLDIRESTRKIGSKLMVVMIPTKEQVYWEVAHNDLPHHEKLQVDRPFGLVQAFCDQEGVECCDLGPELEKRAAQGEQLYLRISSHWNTLGNQVGGQVVAGCLNKLGWLNDLGHR